MSEFLPLARKEVIDERRNRFSNDDEGSFKPLKKDDRASSFSYSLQRLKTTTVADKKDEFTSDDFSPLTRAISFAHKGLTTTSSDNVYSRKDHDFVGTPNSLGAVIIVDTFSTGAVIAHTLLNRGYKVIRVFSGELNPDLLDMVLTGLNTNFIATLALNALNPNREEAIEDLIVKLASLQLGEFLAVIPGAETGVELADELSERLKLRTNGTRLTDARRNKYIMGETIRSQGIRAVKQTTASSWEEVVNFLENWNPDPFKVILKPMDSAGSDGVTLCLSLDEVQLAFNKVYGKVNGLGILNTSILVQEYLEGVEYVVDIVSREGQHKVVAVWEYDRRPVNGAGFVCFGQTVLTTDHPRVPAILSYQKQVITALGIANGPTHGEVKWFKDEPVLVEVGARCHGGEGAWVDVVNEVIGYNQAGVTISAYLDGEAYDTVPSQPDARLAHGMMKWIIVTQSEGTLVEVNPDALHELTSLQSYRGHQFFVEVGERLRKTVDCFTWGGYVKLVHVDEDQLVRDYQRLEELEKAQLFTVQLE